MVVGDPEADCRGGGLDPGLDAEFLEDVGDVDACGLRAHVQGSSDLAVRLAVGEQGEDLPFALG